MVYAGEEATLYGAVREGLALYQARRWFDAHEVWEAAWAGEVGRTKETLRALIQIAAGLHKHAESNRRGPSKLFAKAKATLEEVTSGCSSCLGLDLVSLVSELERALGAADAYARGETEVIPPPALPATTGPHGVIYLHGFASGPSSSKARAIVPALRESGYTVEVPDLNEDDFEHLTVSRALAQAKRLVRDRTVVIGSSFGGYVATLLAAKDERVKALVLMAPAFDMANRMRGRYGERAIEAWQSSGTTLVEHHAWGGRHAIGYGLLEDAANHPPFPKVRVPTYVLQGDKDEVVPPAVTRRFTDENAALAELDLTDDDHGLVQSSERALRAARRLIAGAGLEAEPRPATIEEAEARLAAIEHERSER